MSTSSGTCFQIINSTILAEYNDIIISDTLSIVKNQTDLETYFKQLGTATKNGKAAFQCSKNDDYGQVRYFSSAYIASIVSDQSRNCSNTKQVPILCKNIVETAKKSFDDYLIKNQCSQDHAMRINNYLAMVNSINNEDGCFTGFFVEQRLCGFIGQNEAINYCKNTNPQDSCCNIVNTPSKPTVEHELFNPKSPLAPEKNLRNPKQTIINSESTPSQDKNLIISLSICLFFLLLLCGVLYVMYRRMKRLEYALSHQSLNTNAISSPIEPIKPRESPKQSNKKLQLQFSSPSSQCSF